MIMGSDAGAVDAAGIVIFGMGNGC
jgi:hypothetical protein